MTLVHGPGPLRTEIHAQPVLGMGIPDRLGAFLYDPATGSVRLAWKEEFDLGAVEAIRSTLRTLRERSGGGLEVDLNVVGPRSTYHPLGGAVLGKACDSIGRVHGYRDLYVVDASLIPGSTGCCSPAWTVAALAERCLERILHEDFGP